MLIVGKVRSMATPDDGHGVLILFDVSENKETIFILLQHKAILISVLRLNLLENYITFCRFWIFNNLYLFSKRITGS